eukprot:403365781
MEAGNVYQTEQLKLPRKRYPMSDVIYLIEPTPASISKVLEDFPEIEQFSYDHYGDVHLCFLTTVPDEQIKLMTLNQKLIHKVKTFYEVNLDFTVWQDNIFKITTKMNSMTKLINPGNSSKVIVEELAHKLFSLCSVMNERPYIRYQKDSFLCDLLAHNVNEKLKYLYGSNQIEFRQPRGTLLILDRTFDLISPLVHDYHYQSVIYDYLKVPENGTLDKIIPKEQGDDQRQAASEQSKKLNEDDMIWQKYKALHIAETFGFLQDEIKGLRQDQANMKKLANKEELHHDDISKILKSIPEFEKRKTQVLIHLDLAQKVTDKMQNPKMNIMKLIEFEQSIISGVSDQGQTLSENFIAKELTKIIKILGRAEDKLRILSIYLLCYALPDADFKTVLSLVETQEEKNVLKLIRDYNKQEPVKKLKRTYPQLSNSEFNEYKRKYANEIQEMYDILRTQPQIVKLAKEALNNQLDTRVYPYCGDEKLMDSQRNQAAAKWARHDRDNDNDERLIISVIGGLSHYEICCLQNLDKINGSQNLVLGSTQIITAEDFIENLVPQRKGKRGHDSDDEDGDGKIVIDDDDEEAQREIEKVKQKRLQQKQKKTQPMQKNLQKKGRNNEDSDDDTQNANVDHNEDNSDDDKQSKLKKANLANKSIKSSYDTTSNNKSALSKITDKFRGNKSKGKSNKDMVDLEDVHIEDKSGDSDDDVKSRNKNKKIVSSRSKTTDKNHSKNRKRTKDSDEEEDDSDYKLNQKKSKNKARQETDSEDDEEKQKKSSKYDERKKR